MDFQACIFDVIARHAVIDEPTDCVGTELEPQSTTQVLGSGVVAQNKDAEIQLDSETSAPEKENTIFLEIDNGAFLKDEAGFGRLPSLNHIYAAQYVVTASLVRASSGPSELPHLGSSLLSTSVLPIGRSNSAQPVRTESGCFRRAPSDSNASSYGDLSVPAVQCRFLLDDAPVWVIPAPVKQPGRMREKVAEYKAEGAQWPRAGSILDPVRATVVCQGPANMIEIAEWFLTGASCDKGYNTGRLTVCKIKNKFAMSKKELVGICLCGCPCTRILLQYNVLIKHDNF